MMREHRDEIEELRRLNDSRPWRLRGLAVLVERALKHERLLDWLADLRDEPTPT